MGVTSVLVSVFVIALAGWGAGVGANCVESTVDHFIAAAQNVCQQRLRYVDQIVVFRAGYYSAPDEVVLVCCGGTSAERHCSARH